MNRENFMKDMAEAPTQHLSHTVQTDSPALREMIDRAKRTPIRTLNPEDDLEMIQRVKHTMRSGELLMEWYARVGLSKSQAALMSEAEILGWAARSEQQNANDPSAPSPAWQPKPVPAKFILEIAE